MCVEIPLASLSETDICCTIFSASFRWRDVSIASPQAMQPTDRGIVLRRACRELDGLV